MPTEYTGANTSFPEKTRGLSTQMELETGGSNAVAKMDWTGSQETSVLVSWLNN